MLMMFKVKISSIGQMRIIEILLSLKLMRILYSMENIWHQLNRMMMSCQIIKVYDDDITPKYNSNDEENKIDIMAREEI